MLVEKPLNWQSPRRDYGQEDIPELFAMMFLDSMVAVLCTSTKNFDLPIATDIDPIINKRKEVGQRLKDRGLYFYEPEGSIFMDYKIMRSQAYLKLEQAMGKDDVEEPGTIGYSVIKEQFRAEMSTEEALQLARNFVAQWEW